MIAASRTDRWRPHEAQVVRAAIQLDEMLHASRAKQQSTTAGAVGWDQARYGHGYPTVVAQIRTPAGSEQLRYTCGPRVIAVMTKRVNAIRREHVQ